MLLLAPRTTEPRAEMLGEVLTIDEFASRLKHAEKNGYAMRAAGEIVAFKIRGKQRIMRTALDQRIETQPLGGDGGGRGE